MDYHINRNGTVITVYQTVGDSSVDLFRLGSFYSEKLNYLLAMDSKGKVSRYFFEALTDKVPLEELTQAATEFIKKMIPKLKRVDFYPDISFSFRGKKIKLMSKRIVIAETTRETQNTRWKFNKFYGMITTGKNMEFIESINEDYQRVFIRSFSIFNGHRNQWAYHGEYSFSNRYLYIYPTQKAPSTIYLKRGWFKGEDMFGIIVVSMNNRSMAYNILRTTCDINNTERRVLDVLSSAVRFELSNPKLKLRSYNPNIRYIEYLDRWEIVSGSAVFGYLPSGILPDEISKVRKHLVLCADFHGIPFEDIPGLKKLLAVSAVKAYKVKFPQAEVVEEDEEEEAA